MKRLLVTVFLSCVLYSSTSNIRKKRGYGAEEIDTEICEGECKGTAWI